MSKPIKATSMQVAKEAYDKILAIKQSYPEFPPSEEQEQREHDRVYWERVKVIYQVYHDAWLEGFSDGK